MEDKYLQLLPVCYFLSKMYRIYKFFITTYLNSANMGAFSFGTAWSYTATALPSMKRDPYNDFNITRHSESLITALLFLGCIIASPLNGYCLEKFGRRGAMMLTNIPCVLAWIIIGVSSNVNIIYVARILTGMHMNELS